MRIAESTITKEAAVQEFLGWNHRFQFQMIQVVHKSDVRITTNGIHTHYDLIIPSASVFNAKRDFFRTPVARTMQTKAECNR